MLCRSLPSDSGPVPQEVCAPYNVGNPDPVPHHVQHVAEPCIPDPVQKVVQDVAVPVEVIRHVGASVPVGQITEEVVQVPARVTEKGSAEPGPADGYWLNVDVPLPVERIAKKVVQIPASVTKNTDSTAASIGFDEGKWAAFCADMYSNGFPSSFFRSSSSCQTVLSNYKELEDSASTEATAICPVNGESNRTPSGHATKVNTAATVVATRDFFAKYPATLSDPGFNLSDGCHVDALVNAAAHGSDCTPSGHATEATTAVSASAPVLGLADEESNAAAPAIVSTAQNHCTPSGLATKVSADTEPERRPRLKNDGRTMFDLYDYHHRTTVDSDTHL